MLKIRTQLSRALRYEVKFGSGEDEDSRPSGSFRAAPGIQVVVPPNSAMNGSAA